MTHFSHNSGFFGTPQCSPDLSGANLLYKEQLEDQAALSKQSASDEVQAEKTETTTSPAEKTETAEKPEAAAPKAPESEAPAPKESHGEDSEENTPEESNGVGDEKSEELLKTSEENARTEDSQQGQEFWS